MKIGQKKYMQPEEAFFKLIRLGIGTCHDRNVMLDKAGWAAVYELGRRHALAPIVLDGVERLSIMQKPPTDVVMPWIGLVQQVEAANRRLNRAAVMICDKFTQEGMGTVLLKGQGISVFYLRPLHRTPGDVDLWMDASRKRVVDYVRRYTPGVKVVYHHVDFPVLKDISIELHFRPSWMNCWRTNSRLQHYFAEWKPYSLLHKVQLPERVGEVAVPTLAMNRIYLLVHIYRHLFDEGIGLCQLLDYYFVLFQSCSESDRKEAVLVLKQLHLKRFASAVMYVLQEVFGMADEHLLVDPSERYGKRLLKEVMQAGNFGQYDERIQRESGETAFRRFLRKVGRNMRFFSDYPEEVFWSPLFKMWHYIWRLRHGYLGNKKK